MKLNKKHMKAIKLIIEGATEEKIVKECKISPSTLYNWKRDEDFAAELETQRQLSVENAREVLTTTVEKAAFTMVKLLDSHVDSVRFKAAKEIIDRVYGSPTQRQELVADITQETNLNAETVLQDEDAKLLLRQLYSKINEL